MNSRIQDALLTLLLAAGALALFYAALRSRSDLWLLLPLLAVLIPTLIANFIGVPFVPVPFPAAERMVQESGLKPGETVYDLGCGDGRVVYLAVAKGAGKGVGLELSPLVYLLAKVRQILWRFKAEIRFADFNRQDLSDADVIFCYLNPELLRKLQPKLEHELKAGTRVISYDFPFTNWQESRLVPPGPDWGKAIRVYEVPGRHPSAA